jgi:hypothetical protein
MDEMKALSDVFNLRPEMFMAGMRSLENVRQSDQQRLQQQELANQQATLQNQYASEMNPIKADQARFGLMKDRAMFSGDLAASQGQVRKEREAGNYTPDQIPQVLTQAAALVANPSTHTPALNGVMRGVLKNAYIPEIMDSWTGPQWAANLPKMLQSYTSLLPKNAAALELQGSKNDSAMQRELEKTRRAETVANIAASTRKSIQNKAPANPKNYDAYATELMKMGDLLSMPGATEDDLARAQIYYDRGREYRRIFIQDKINTTPAAAPAIDLTQLPGPDGKPRFPPKPIPQPTVDSRVNSAKAITTEAEYNSLPSGALYTVNGVTKRKK